MTNRFEKLLSGRNAAIGIIVGIDSALCAETLARAGYDFLFLDQQHGVIDDATLLSQIQAAQGVGCTVLVRPPWSEPAGVMRALDYGANGIIAPLIDSAEEAASLVSAMRYPPDGKRSWGPIRAGLPDWNAYKVNANRSHIAIAMIETASAYQNLDAILAVPGLDGILIGPNDLALSLGLDGQPMVGDSRFAEIVRDIAGRAIAAGVVPGSHCGDTETAQVLIETGFRFVSINADLSVLYAAAQATVNALKNV